MIELRPLVVDANIMVRAVFGTAAQLLFKQAEESVTLCTPDICMQEVARHTPLIAQRRGLDVAIIRQTLEELHKMITVVESDFYRAKEADARRRIATRDVDDWPALATALLLDCPIWTEDQDFFGTGVATWTTNNVGILLRRN